MFCCWQSEFESISVYMTYVKIWSFTHWTHIELTTLHLSHQWHKCNKTNTPRQIKDSHWNMKNMISFLQCESHCIIYIVLVTLYFSNYYSLIFCVILQISHCYRVSRKTLKTFHFVISRLIMHQIFKSLTFFNSHLHRLLRIVRNCKYWAIFDKILKEKIAETQH